MELSADQVDALTGGRDTALHHHEYDRLPTHDTLAQLQAVENTAFPVTTYAASYNDDYIFGDTTVAGFNVTLLAARAGRIVVVSRISGANNLTVLPTGAETINGAASLVLSSSHAPVRLKAIKGTGYESV